MALLRGMNLLFNTRICMLSLWHQPNLETEAEGVDKRRQSRGSRMRRIQYEGLLSVFDEGLIDATDLWESPFSRGAIQLYLPLCWLIGVLPQQC